MSCNKCSCSACSCLNVIISIIIGIIVGVLYFTGIITSAVTVLWILFGIAAASLIFLFLAQLTAAASMSTILARCLCRNSKCLLLSALGTIAFVIISFLSGLTNLIATAVLLGITALFAALLFISIAYLICCISSGLCALGATSANVAVCAKKE